MDLCKVLVRASCCSLLWKFKDVLERDVCLHQPGCDVARKDSSMGYIIKFHVSAVLYPG